MNNLCYLILRIETWAQIGQNYWATSRPKHQPLDSSSRVEKARTRAASRPFSRCFACGLPSARRFLSLRPRRRPRAGFAVAAQLLLRWPAHISARPCLCDRLRATLSNRCASFRPPTRLRPYPPPRFSRRPSPASAPRTSTSDRGHVPPVPRPAGSRTAAPWGASRTGPRQTPWSTAGHRRRLST